MAFRASSTLAFARLTRPAPSQTQISAITSPNGLRFYSAPVDGTIPAAKQKYVPTSGTYPKGFLVSGTHVGVKPTNKSTPDLAFLASETPCGAAAVFTKNKFQAAPVTVSRNMLNRRGNSGVRSVIVNSGCANAVTGKGGMEDAEKMGTEADKCFDLPKDGKGGSSIVMSTGVIGQRLPIQKILQRIPFAYDALGSSHDHWLAAARAICTTDTFPKLISRTFSLPSSPSVEYRIAGMTKGAGEQVTSGSSRDYATFQNILSDFATDLAKLVVRDGEGATKFVTIRVTESSSEVAARKIASTIARSPLVKTALYGKDANWGRILCATGYSLISEPGQEINQVDEIVPAKTSVSFIPSDGSPELKLLVNGEPETVDEARASEILEHEDLEILVRLRGGNEEATYWTCDYSHEYITINGDYRT
ncbi:uncharacterized protein L3040_008646 [Drepanopeziza brunnea f. sp. 'multigermtubi']|uniref:uncharacterized protein n=1 Tax=Drepanopeziza brunnea f. sp. 'multigermtubi' TaxID=698441 RepID=UPI00238B07F7|nr:hypothetical protein L3040_008646 [Drepanopeziza brunnea f. sp. 'multigermtubi']